MKTNLISILGEASSRFFSFMIREITFSAVLFVLILLLIILLRKKSPLWHMGLWTLVLLRLVLPPGFSNPVAKYNVLNNVRFIKEVNNMLPESNNQEFHDYSSYKQSASSTQNTVVAEIETSKIVNTYKNSQVPFWKIGIFCIWFLGFLITFSIYIKRYLYFRRLIWNSSNLRNENCLAILAHWRRAFKIKRSIRVVYSQQCLSPFTIGIIKPVIYLPQSILESDDNELLNSVFSHEVAHIKHFDDLWIKFQNIIQSIYFFYPVVWYVNSRIQLARECLRDTLVISKGDISPKILGNGILSLIRMNLVGADNFLYLAGFGNEKKKVTYRLRNLKSNRVLMYQRILIYLFLVGLGAYLIPIFGSIESPEKLTGINETEWARLGTVLSIDKNSFTGDDLSGASTDEKTSMFDSKIHTNNKLDSTDKYQKSPEIEEIGAEKHIKPNHVSTAPQEEQLPSSVEIPDEIIEEELGGIGLGKVDVEGIESSAEGEENAGTKKEDGSLLNKVVGGALGRLIENDSNTPVRLTGQITYPKLIKKIKPRYPIQARQARVEGVLILEATTDVYGRVNQVKVLRSIPLLDRAAVEAVQQWIYEPMIINGKPRSVIFKVTVTFKLEKSP